MSIKNKLQVEQDAMTQTQRALKAQELLKGVYTRMKDTDGKIQAIADEGSVNTVDAEIKTTLLGAWDVIKQAITELEANEDIMELLTW